MGDGCHGMSGVDKGRCWSLAISIGLVLGACSASKPAAVKCPELAITEQAVGADEPVAWPADTPEIYRAEEFERIVSAATTEINPPVELLEVDCSEAPCYAVIRTGSGLGACPDLTRTKAWRPYSGDTGAMGDWAIECSGNVTDRICILATYAPSWSCDVQQHVLDRNELRIGALKDRWACGDGFRTSTACDAGVDQAALDELVNGARESGSDALVVVKNGRLVGEWYFDEEQGPIESMSATKSIVGLAIGLLIDDGKLESLDTPVSTLFPEWADGPKSEITVRHLLAHSSGLEGRPTTEDIYASDDFVKFGLEAAVENAPLERIFYNNRAFNILAGVVEKASGRRMDEYLKERLFEPLGITDTSWTLDEAGNPHAMSGLQIRPLDLAKIGQLMLDRGVWRGKRVLSEEWIAQSTAPAAEKFPKLGLGWWIVVDLKTTLDDEIFDTWREAGVDEAFIEKVMPMKDRVFTRDEFFDELMGIFGGKEGLETWYDNTWRRGLPDGKPAEISFPGYYAEGYLGQYLVVLPEKRLVVVRMRRAPGAPESKEDARKNGFQGILELAQRL